MSDTADTTPETIEETPETVETTTETSETPETPTPEAPKPLSELSDDELLALASNPEELAKYAAPQAKAEPETPEEPEKEEKDEEEDVPERVRLNTLSKDDAKLVNAAIQMVRANPSLSVAQAIAAITHSPEPPKTEEPEAPKESTEKPKSLIEEAREEIVSILAELKTAKDNYETAKDLELTDKLLDAKVKLFAAQEAEARNALAAETEFQAELSTALSKAVELYPESDTPGTEFYTEVQAEIARIGKTSPEFFRNPNYPLAIAGLVGARRGVAPAFASPKIPVSQPKTVAAPARSARPASLPVLGGNASRDVTNDRAAVFRQVESIRSMEDLEALADAVGSIKSTKLTI